MFPSKKALDKTFNDFNNKASSLIKFQSSPKKNVTSPKKEKYKTLKESAKPMYSKARLTMDGNGFRDHHHKMYQMSRQQHPHTHQRRSSIGESDNSSKNSRSSSFEQEESENDHSLDDQVKNNVPIPISIECEKNKPSLIKQKSIELSFEERHTPKLNEDYFLVRTYQRGGSSLVRVPFTEEEKEILKRQKEENESLRRQKEENESLKRQKEENESLKRQKEENEIFNRQIQEEMSMNQQNDQKNQSNNSKDSSQQIINQTQKSIKITRTDSILSETDSMKDFTDFCHSRIEMVNINKNLTKSVPATCQKICLSDSYEDNLDLLHIMDDSGKIVWNSVAEKYDVGPFIWYDNSVLHYKNNQEYHSEDSFNNASVAKPDEMKQQCNIDITFSDENLEHPEVFLPEHNLEDSKYTHIDNKPNGYRHEVQSPDPRNYADSFITDKNLSHEYENSYNNLI